MYLNTDEVESKLLGNSSGQHCLTSPWCSIEQHTTLLSDGTLTEQPRVLQTCGQEEGKMNILIETGVITDKYII